MTLTKYQKKTFLLLGILTFIRLVISMFVDLDGAPAYYAMWSRHLQLSYFDHPAVTAILIRISTFLFGWNSFAIKLPGILMFSAISVYVYKSILLLKGSEKGAFYSVALLNFTPWIASSFGIKGVNPDIPFILFYIMAFYYFIKLYREDNPKYLYIISFITILGINSKYKMVFIYPAITIATILIPNLRKLWQSKHLYIAGSIAMLGIIPIIVWNVNNNFASFSYHLIERQSAFNVSIVRYLRFLMNQLFIMGIFIPVILFKNAIKTRNTESSKLCISFVLPAFLIFSVVALFFSETMQNWWASVYVILFIAYGVNKQINKYDRWILYFVSFVSIFTTVLYLSPFLKIKQTSNFLDHHLFREAAKDLTIIMQKEKYIATPRYRTTAMINFFMPDKIIYSVDYRKKDQFQLWHPVTELIGKDIILVIGGSQFKGFPIRNYKYDKAELIFERTYTYNSFFKRTFQFYRLINFGGIKNARD